MDAEIYRPPRGSREELLLEAWASRRERNDSIEPLQIAATIGAIYAGAGLSRPRLIVVPSPLTMAIAGVIAECAWDDMGNRPRCAINPVSDTSCPILQAVLSAISVEPPDALRVSGNMPLSMIPPSLFARGREFRGAPRWNMQGDRLANLDVGLVNRVHKFWAVDQETQFTIDQTTAAICDPPNRHSDPVFVAVRSIARAGLSCEPQSDVAMRRLTRWEQRFHGRRYVRSPGQGLFLPTPRYVGGVEVSRSEGNRAWEDAEINAGFRYDHPKFCLVSDFPEVMRFDDANRLHCADGPSCRWRDGFALYHLHGIRVPEHAVIRPQEIILDHSHRQRSTVVIRTMIDHYGPVRYIRDSGMRNTQRDAFGMLYCIRVPNDVPIVMVRVLNATPEANGTLSRDDAMRIFGPAARAAAEASPDTRWNEHVLHVPPSVHSAHEGVAWTFGMSTRTYKPAFES